MAYRRCWLVCVGISLVLTLIGSVHGWTSFIPKFSQLQHRSVIARTTTTAGLSMSRQNNPISSMLNDFAGSILGNSGISSSNAQLDENLMSLLASTTWDDVCDTLASLQTPQERTFRDNLATGRGVGSPLHTLRLFDDSNDDDNVRVVFYRDSASWCPYCHKVWMCLEQKRIPYRVEKINMNCYGDKPASFYKIQPGGQIPVAKIDGRVYGQSNDIIFALEELFPDKPSLLLPEQRPRAQELLRLERRLFSAWLTWLTSRGNAKYNKQNFVAVLQEVENALQQSSSGPFFLGNSVSLVDILFAPFLERMCASLLYFKGFEMRVPPPGQQSTKSNKKYPHLSRWFDAMETLPSYQLTKSDYYTHCWDLPPQLGGCTYEDEGEPYRNAIDGQQSLLDASRKSWALPLEEHGGGAEPDWTWAQEGAEREAVERVSANHENIVTFAARGAGRGGMPPVSAPLADPRAVPNEAVKNGIDAVLRVLCMAMLEGVEQQEGVMAGMAKSMVKEGGKEYAEGMVASLAYLRDRVGVPRDMKLPAARLLRAHLNWAIDKILDAQENS